MPAVPELRATPAAPGVRSRECWLRPFAPPAAARTLRARVRLEGGRLTVRYVLEGELEDLCLPWPAPPPRRRDGLWQSTCLEAFLAARGAAAYHEINLAPAGHWACYAFSGPRLGMRHEAALESLDWRTHRVPGHYAIRFTIELARLGLDPTGLELGISAVLGRKGGAREFWALAHGGETPDFHRRESFLLRLP